MKQFFLPLFCLCLSGTNPLGAQCAPQMLNCNSPVAGCDFSTNHADFWHEIYWWDPLISSHDMPEVSTDLNLIVRDTCQGGLTVRYLLFLDLDSDGTQETVVDSDNLPAPGTVNFNNAANPNYLGGTPREFDNRPLPGDLLWRFALQTVVTGDSTEFRVRWSNAVAPDMFEMPLLAYGQHKVRWMVSNSAGETVVCEKPVFLKDCKPPVVVCLNGLSVNIMPTQLITLWATDFLQYAEDNVTPTHLIHYGIRKAGTGTGFPLDDAGNPLVSVTYACSELGVQTVELWARDATGNADFCETFVIVQDNNLNCNKIGDFLEACISTACNEPVEEVVINFVTPDFVPYFDLGPCGSLPVPLPPDIEVVIEPELDDFFLAGVSAYDLVLIQKHIDGTDPFNTPYQWIAADANNDKVIDTTDILVCRKLILGIYNELPNNKSWRFVDAAYTFPSPDPLSAPFPETITATTGNPPANNPAFIGVKICDLSCGSLVGFYENMPEDQHAIGEIQPNPAHENESGWIPVSLLADETVFWELRDVSGRLLYQATANYPPGPALLEIPAPFLMPSGLYIWQVRIGQKVKSGKWMR